GDTGGLARIRVSPFQGHVDGVLAQWPDSAELRRGGLQAAVHGDLARDCRRRPGAVRQAVVPTPPCWRELDSGRRRRRAATAVLIVQTLLTIGSQSHR